MFLHVFDDFVKLNDVLSLGQHFGIRVIVDERGINTKHTIKFFHNNDKGQNLVLEELKALGCSILDLKIKREELINDFLIKKEKKPYSCIMKDIYEDGRPRKEGCYILFGNDGYFLCKKVTITKKVDVFVPMFNDRFVLEF